MPASLFKQFAINHVKTTQEKRSSRLQRAINSIAEECYDFDSDDITTCYYNDSIPIDASE